MTRKDASLCWPVLLAAVCRLPGLGGEAAAASRSAEGGLAVPLSQPYFLRLLANTPELLVAEVGDAGVGVLVQAQTQSRRVTLSQSQAFPRDASYNGTSAGLWIPLKESALRASFFIRSEENVTALVSVVPYREQDPVPGACNTEFDMENDPNVHLGFTAHETVVEFAPANLGVARNLSPPACDVGQGTHSRWRLTYDLYQYFLSEVDVSEAGVFDGLARMSSVQNVEQYGRKIASLTSFDKTRLLVSPFASIGVIYAVVVRDPLRHAASLYVPVSTYSCGLAPPGPCRGQGPVSSRVFFAVLGLYGLFVCFAGHRFPVAGLFFLGFLLFCLLSFVLVGRFSGASYDLCLVSAAVTGGLGGALFALCGWRLRAPLLLTALAGLVPGFLLAAVIMFTPLVNEKMLRSDVLFWTCVTAISIVLPAVVLAYPRALSILSCAWVGSYTAVLMVGSYLPTSLPYILLSVIRRAVSPLFSQAIILAPFQSTDGALLALWAVLAVGGAASQHFLTRDEPPFPRGPHPSRGESQGPPACDERSALLGGAEGRRESCR
uniref:Transmembrane 7 superfamily member 3-like n=1 Tax=Lepisosteus oculatus TaxID=7918 RepID=W5MHV4_LEPOC|nr:PREDICTED: transmembrane 7 superfamily member 3-like [Lepisosteus oculatus]